MTDHKKPMTEQLRQALINHRLAVDTPSQLADSFRHGWLAAQAAQPAQIPAGYVLVPVEPTPEMLRVDIETTDFVGIDSAAAIYRAMIAAAPDTSQKEEI